MLFLVFGLSGFSFPCWLFHFSPGLLLVVWCSGGLLSFLSFSISLSNYLPCSPLPLYLHLSCFSLAPCCALLGFGLSWQLAAGLAVAFCRFLGLGCRGSLSNSAFWPVWLVGRACTSPSFYCRCRYLPPLVGWMRVSAPTGSVRVDRIPTLCYCICNSTLWPALAVTFAGFFSCFLLLP